MAPAALTVLEMVERGGEFRGEMQQVGAAPVYPPNTASAANQAKPAVANPQSNPAAAPASKDAS